MAMSAACQRLTFGACEREHGGPFAERHSVAPETKRPGRWAASRRAQRFEARGDEHGHVVESAGQCQIARTQFEPTACNPHRERR